MNTLERETDPLKLAAMIAKSDRESLIWQEEDKLINAFLNGTAPAQIENVILKDQVNALIQSGETVNLILQQLKPVSKFFNNINRTIQPDITLVEDVPKSLSVKRALKGMAKQIRPLK